MRKYVRVAAAATTVLLGAVAAPVHGGQGTSQWCNDGINTTEIPIINDPITLNLEVVNTGSTNVQVCYSTTPNGSSAPAVTGGMIVVESANGTVTCIPDSSPVVLAVSCSVADPNSTSPGKTVSVSVRFQHLIVPIGPLGAEVGAPGSPACLRGFTIYGPTGVIGPFNIGVC